MQKFYVYILKCSDESYYTGFTNDIERRFLEHQDGFYKTAYTFTRRPVRLMFCTEFLDARSALDFEQQVKGWSRKKKEAIIANDWEALKPLAECKNETSHKKK